jgi:hypothetical protein
MTTNLFLAAVSTSIEHCVVVLHVRLVVYNFAFHFHPGVRLERHALRSNDHLCLASVPPQQAGRSG